MMICRLPLTWPSATLAENRLHFEIRRDRTDAEPGKTYLLFGQDLRTGGAVWPCTPRGCFPRPKRTARSTETSSGGSRASGRPRIRR